MHATFGNDAVMGALWLIVNGLLAVGSWRVARRIDPDADRVDMLTDALVIGMTVIVSSTVLAGVSGFLSGGVLLASVAIVALTGVVMTRSATPDRNSCKPHKLARSAGMTPGAGMSCTTAAPAANPSRRQTMERTGWTLIWTLLAGYLLLHMTVDGLLKFPAEFDSLMYHIPMIDEWLQARSLFAPDSAFWWTPGNSEILGLWCVAPFSGDFLIALNNLPTMALWVVATLSTGRSLGMSRSWSHLAAVGVVAVHTSFHETIDASNDLALATFFTTAVSYALRYFRTDRRRDLVLGGLSLGLLAGVKYFSVGYVSLVVGVWVVGTMLPGGLASALRAALVLGLTALPAGAYWYARNAVLSGSPVYPMGLTGATPEVGYPNLSETSFWGNPDPGRWSLVVPSLWKMTGPCHLAAVLGAPLIVIWLLAMAFHGYRTRRPAIEGRIAVAFALLLSGCAVLLIISPWAVEDQPGTLNHLRWAYTPVRYGLCFLSLAVVGFTWLLASSSRAFDKCLAARANSAPSLSLAGRAEVATATLLAGAVLVQLVLRFFYWHSQGNQTTGMGEFSAALTVAMVIVSWGLWFLSGSGRRISRRVAVAACCTAVLCTTGIHLLSQRWHEGYDQHFDRFVGLPMFTEFSRNQADLGKICVLDQRVYPFYGAARQRHICRPRYLGSFDALIRYLRDRDISLVVTHSGRKDVFGLYHDAPGWLKSDPATFVLLLEGWNHVVYRCQIEADKDVTPKH